MRMMAKCSAVITLLALAGVSQASNVDINGGSSWGGWTYQGNSVQETPEVIWSGGDTSGSYDVYTTWFTLDGSESVSGTVVGSTGLDDGTGFIAGNRIIGIGIAPVGETLNYNSSVFWKFDPDKNGYAPASSVGGADGKDSSSSDSDAGDFNVQANGIQQATRYWAPNVFHRNDGTGITDTQINALDAIGSPFRAFAVGSEADGITSVQFFADVDELAKGPWSVNIGSDYNLVIAATVGSNSEPTLVALQDVAAVPVPAAAWAGMMLVGGMGGVAGLKRKLRRA